MPLVEQRVNMEEHCIGVSIARALAAGMTGALIHGNSVLGARGSISRGNRCLKG